ncbi:MAG: hypothetical protein NTV34_09305 [Proteobacteria bacterium]|nr:hypothetical protein [Pseudomonadota bacterium]
MRTAAVLKWPFLKWPVKFFGKIYIFILWAIMILRQGRPQDPSQILLDHFTPAQKAAEKDLLNAENLKVKPFGEILVLLPFRDKWQMTQDGLEALAKQQFNSGLQLRTVLIDHCSAEPDTATGIKNASKLYPSLNITSMRADYPFNYSRLNNDGFNQHVTEQTKFVLCLNNDVVLGDPYLIQNAACYLATIPQLGVVGTNLNYPDGRIQHLFAAPGIKIIAAHPLKGCAYNKHDAWFQKPARPVAAVTGAFMMLRSSDYNMLGGFDQQLPTLGQDIDLCLRAQSELKKFCASVFGGNSLHLEGPTKAAVFPLQEIRRFEVKWGGRRELYTWYARAFSRWSESPLLHLGWEPRYVAEVFGIEGES